MRNLILVLLAYLSLSVSATEVVDNGYGEASLGSGGSSVTGKTYTIVESGNNLSSIKLKLDVKCNQIKLNDTGMEDNGSIDIFSIDHGPGNQSSFIVRALCI